MIRVAQVGTFDVDNLGDLLFPMIFSRILAELAEDLGTEIECTSFSPNGLRPGALYADQAGSLALEHLDRIDAETPFDLIFIGGGDIIREDDASLGAIYQAKSSAGFAALSSPTAGPDRRLVLLMPGVPFPLSRSFKNFLANSFRRLRFGAVRDRISAGRLSALIPGDMGLAVLPDMVAALPHFHTRTQLAALEHALVSPELRSRGYICFQAPAEFCTDISVAARALRRLQQQTGLAIVLLAIGNCLGDEDFLRRLAQEFSFALALAPATGTLMQKVSVIAGSRAFIGTSLHGAILAHGYGVPHFSFSGAALNKIRGFYDTCSTGICYSDFTACVEDFDAIGKIIAMNGACDQAGTRNATVCRDYGRIKRFVRKALESEPERPVHGYSRFELRADGRFRKFHALRQDIESRLAHVHFYSLARRSPRLASYARRSVKFIWWSVTWQLYQKYLMRRERRAVRPNIRHRALAVPLSWASMTYSTPSVAVICHMFYPEMAGEIRRYLDNISFEFVLCITTDTSTKKTEIERIFKDWRRGKMEIRLTENRGRDVAAKLLAFRDVYHQHDYILHIHSKLSPYGAELAGWRTYLLDTLIGSREIVASIFEVFRTLPNVGMIAPQHMPAIRRGIDWVGEREGALGFCRRFGLNLEIDRGTDFPSGSMFWARSAALSPILDIGLSFSDFPAERGQIGGTLAHVIERLYFPVCEAAGYDWMLIEKPDPSCDSDEWALPAASPEDLNAVVDLLNAPIAPKA